MIIETFIRQNMDKTLKMYVNLFTKHVEFVISSNGRDLYAFTEYKTAVEIFNILIKDEKVYTKTNGQQRDTVQIVL